MRAIISEFKRKITRQVSWNLGSCLENGAGEETERRPCLLNEVGIFNKECGEHGLSKQPTRWEEWGKVLEKVKKPKALRTASGAGLWVPRKRKKVREENTVLF